MGTAEMATTRYLTMMMIRSLVAIFKMLNCRRSKLLVGKSSKHEYTNEARCTACINSHILEAPDWAYYIHLVKKMGSDLLCRTRGHFVMLVSHSVNYIFVHVQLVLLRAGQTR